MGLRFGDLDDDDKARLWAEYQSSSPKVDAIRRWGFDGNLRYIGRQLRRWASGGRGQHNAPLPAPIPRTQEEEDIISHDNWQRYLSGLAQSQSHAIVAHVSDVHFPFQDTRALALAYKVIEHVQPDIIVCLSDSLDFHLLSKFGVDPNLNDMEDELDRAEHYWNPHIHALNAAAPAAQFVAIMGNHERWLIHEINKKSPYTRKTVWRRFVEIVKCGGRVQWLGNRDRVTVGDWIIQHGTHSTKYPANQVIESLGFQRSSMFGHAHRLSYTSKRGVDKSVHSVGAGCLCHLNPHWKKGTELTRLWQHGFAFADIALRGTASGYHNLEFTPDNSGALETRIGFTSITS